MDAFSVGRMLGRNRKKLQRLRVGADITIRIVGVNNGEVTLEIDAPAALTPRPESVYQRIVIDSQGEAHLRAEGEAGC
jgi:sRNA-binding carbon storage regulator CsrA